VSKEREIQTFNRGPSYDLGLGKDDMFAVTVTSHILAAQNGIMDEREQNGA
jgi:hypothetical protein